MVLRFLLVACTVALVCVIATPAHAATCHVVGHGLMVKPQRACTPGDRDPLTVEQVCAPKARDYLPVAIRRSVLGAYGVPGWSGADGELDHRVPFFLGGRTDALNLWPEPGAIPNPKDRLESYVYGRVCREGSMRVRTAVSIFRHDWRVAYRWYRMLRWP